MQADCAAECIHDKSVDGADEGYDILAELARGKDPCKSDFQCTGKPGNIIRDCDMLVISAAAAVTSLDLDAVVCCAVRIGNR